MSNYSASFLLTLGLVQFFSQNWFVHRKVTILFLIVGWEANGWLDTRVISSIAKSEPSTQNHEVSAYLVHSLRGIQLQTHINSLRDCDCECDCRSDCERSSLKFWFFFTTICRVLVICYAGLEDYWFKPCLWSFLVYNAWRGQKRFLEKVKVLRGMNKDNMRKFERKKRSQFLSYPLNSY